MECNGICVTAHDVGLPYFGIVYPHPECELHGDPESEYPHHENCSCDECWADVVEENW